MTMWPLMPGAALVLFSAVALAQSDQPASRLPASRTLETLFAIVEKDIVSAADAMPADKYRFAPTNGEFKGVRTFAQQVKHLAATNFILGAAALEVAPPADAGDELGPDTVRTKAQVMAYVRDSFGYLRKAMAAIDDRGTLVKTPPISPFPAGTATRLGLVAESLIHAFDHYGQMVVYLRMNGVVPPASR